MPRPWLLRGSRGEAKAIICKTGGSAPQELIQELQLRTGGTYCLSMIGSWRPTSCHTGSSALHEKTKMQTTQKLRVVAGDK
eukprot:jgi/Botrbrau1/12428/Bobra.0229s0024.1